MVGRRLEELDDPAQKQPMVLPLQLGHRLPRPLERRLHQRPVPGVAAAGGGEDARVHHGLQSALVRAGDVAVHAGRPAGGGDGGSREDLTEEEAVGGGTAFLERVQFEQRLDRLGSTIGSGKKSLCLSVLGNHLDRYLLDSV